MTDARMFVEKNRVLVQEFDRYVLEHPEVADAIPNDSLVVMQIEGDEDFNQWAKETGQQVAGKGNPIVYVIVTELKRVRSRIERLRLELVA